MLSQMTLPQLVLHHARNTPQVIALRQKEGERWTEVSWAAYAERARNCAAGMLALGIGPGSHVAVLADNSIDWVIAQIGTGLIGGVALGCYPTSSADELRHALGHADVKVLFCGDVGFLRRAESISAELPSLERIVVMDAKGATGADERVLGQGALEARGAAALAATPNLLDDIVARQTLDDIGLMVYTSGSTGAPKAAMLAYRNMRTTAEGFGPLLGFANDTMVLSYLPLCHIAEQVMTNFAPLYFRSTVAFGGGLPTLVEDLRAIRPTYFSGVPRVWLRLKAEITATFAAAGKAEALEAAVAAGTADAFETGAAATDETTRAIIAEAKALVGMDRLGVTTSGAASLPVEVLTFFRALRFPLIELYGQTESCGIMTMHRTDHVVPGTVGVPIPTMRLRLAEDGEILVRSESVFRGYYKNPEATADTIVDGWLHTGDVGRLEGDQLRIIDRKKDIMITDGGKNITPAEIEALMRTSDLIQECVLVADGRKYVAALIQVAPAAFPDDAASASYEAVAADSGTQALVADEIRRLNEKLARVAQVKRAVILPTPLSHGLGDLTPTLKLRRFKVHARHRDLIEAVYARRAGFDIYPQGEA